jgi:hypothetical protein
MDNMRRERARIGNVRSRSNPHRQRAVATTPHRQHAVAHHPASATTFARPIATSREAPWFAV